jgi:hypothetical protein
MDCFVAEFIIGPAEGRTRWLLAMTLRAHSKQKSLPSLATAGFYRCAKTIPRPLRYATLTEMMESENGA